MKTKQLIFRWSLVTGGLIALFWTIWYLATGSVPIVASIQITKDWTINLPFGSRWWDITIGPIWTTIIIFLNHPKFKFKTEGDDIAAKLLFNLLFGLASGRHYGDDHAEQDIEGFTGFTQAGVRYIFR